MAYTSKQTARETQAAEEATAKQTAPAFSDQRASTGLQLQQQQLMNTAQAKFVTAQRAGVEEEEPLQGKFETAQRAEEEELLQGKFETAQRAEEEELLQGKFETAQRAEEEELLQGKFETAQRAGVEEEEPLQGKFETAQLAEEEELLQGKFSADTNVQATAQREEKPNNTGLPNQLKAGIESLSGMSLDGVKVHYNSSEPAQLNAHAYAQGTDIHVAPGQEQHLPHEAWHVVQQAQGRVKPTTQMKGTSVNDDVSLETEADVMGAKALQLIQKQETKVDSATYSLQGKQIAQLVLNDDDLEGMVDMSDEDLVSLDLDDAEKEQLGRYRAARAELAKQNEAWTAALATRRRGMRNVDWVYGGKTYHINLGLGVYHVTEESSPKIHYFFEGFGDQIADKPSGNGGKHDKLFSELPKDVQIFVKNNFNALLL